MPQSTDFAELTDQIANALVKAVAARPRGRSGPEDNLMVTWGMQVGTGKPFDPIPTLPDPADPGMMRGRARSLPRSEISKLIARPALTRASVGQLNDSVSTDIPTALGLLKSLAVDPESWMDLFDLDEKTAEQIRKLDPAFTKEFAGLVGKFETFSEDLTSVEFDITPPDPKKKPRDDKWWTPDKFELSLKTEVGHSEVKTSAEGKLVFEL